MSWPILDLQMSSNYEAERGQYRMRVDMLYGAPVVKPRAVAMLFGDEFAPLRINGISVFPSDLAVTVRKVAHVDQNPIKKRRKGYRVRVETVREPGAIWSALNGGCYFVHPEVYAKLKAAQS